MPPKPSLGELLLVPDPDVEPGPLRDVRGLLGQPGRVLHVGGHQREGAGRASSRPRPPAPGRARPARVSASTRPASTTRVTGCRRGPVGAPVELEGAEHEALDERAEPGVVARARRARWRPTAGRGRGGPARRRRGAGRRACRRRRRPAAPAGGRGSSSPAVSRTARSTTSPTWPVAEAALEQREQVLAELGRPARRRRGPGWVRPGRRAPGPRPRPPRGPTTARRR